jgi:hypothetical protein
MASISDVLRNKNITNYVIIGEPTNEKEFLEGFKICKGRATNGSMRYVTNPREFPITWNEIWPELQKLQREEDLQLLKTERNKRLAESDWTQSRDILLDNDEEWKTYRQSLRDITSSYDNLDSVVWPEKPE